MADRIAFELVSPDRLLMSADVEAVMVPGGEGDFTVMPGHMPVISTVRPAVVDVYETWGAAPTTRIFVRGGFVDVTAERVTLLAEHATNLAEVDRADLAQQVRDAAEDITLAKTDLERANAQQVHDSLNELLSAVE
ncbi:F0F1 ATP synthase subunit epsilon [Emcibacter sp. SYSU 3D8]|uniref:F0F1 ATP synthase subunit epsilon n=1 Tax=Emcibacter sp. SYSU 3D8 TaxID=3133969 RepID=UPI0031FE9BE2